MHPDPWPSLGTVIINLDACLRSASQLKGEQNLFLPYVGSELHTAPSTPQILSSSSLLPIAPPLLDTLTPEILLCREGAASKWHTTEAHCPEPWKPPDVQKGDLQEAGGVLPTLGNSPVFPKDIDPFGLAGVVESVNAREVEPLSVNTHK